MTKRRPVDAADEDAADGVAVDTIEKLLLPPLPQPSARNRTRRKTAGAEKTTCPRPSLHHTVGPAHRLSLHRVAAAVVGVPVVAWSPVGCVVQSIAGLHDILADDLTERAVERLEPALAPSASAGRRRLRASHPSSHP